jgi:putative spermidine/putrescine transport system substrate-binding protein
VNEEKSDNSIFSRKLNENSPKEKSMQIKKWYSLFAVLLIVSLLISACGGQTKSGKGPLQEVGKGEGAVAIIAWPGYIERGETDPAYDWVTEFEKDTGCVVSVKTAATSDEMVSLMNQGGFDLVTASGDASNRLIAGGTVQEVNIDLIPSWNTVDS